MIRSSLFPLEDTVFWQPGIWIQPTIMVLFNPVLIRLALVRTTIGVKRDLAKSQQQREKKKNTKYTKNTKDVRQNY